MSTNSILKVGSSQLWTSFLAAAPSPSEGVLTAIMEGLGVGIAVCDCDDSGYAIAQVAPLFAKLAHGAPSHLVGCPFTVFQGAETDLGLWRELTGAMGEKRRYSGELLLYRVDRSPFWSEVSVMPMGEKVAVGLRDITERKEQEERLKDDRAAFRGMFDNAVEGIYRSTVDGHYLEVNPALARMYGYENASQLLNQVSDIGHQIYVDPSFRDIFKSEIAKWGVVRGLEYQVRRRDGAIIWISENARVVRDSKGAIRYYEGFIEDITARKEAERKLQISQQRLLETSRQVGMAEVATSVLHNMGNALNSVNTSAFVAAELVRKSKGASVGKVSAMLKEHAADLGEFVTHDPKGKKLPEFLEQLANHLTKEQASLLNELETLQKSLEHVNEIVAMQQNYAKASNMTETVSPVDIMEDALRMNGNSLVRHGVEVIREYAADLPDVTVPKHKLLQILMNLIRNAQKACDGAEGAKRVWLRVRAARSGAWIRMEVVDNGVGIPRENMTRIFTHGFTTRKDGHGFGLHSGALMAKELGGSLSVSSEGLGKGAMFVVEFPRILEESTKESVFTEGKEEHEGKGRGVR